jgi:hypothetical protein
MTATAQSSDPREQQQQIRNGSEGWCGEAVHLFSLDYPTQRTYQIGVLSTMKMTWTSSQSLKGSMLPLISKGDVNNLLIKQKRNTFCVNCTQRVTERSMFIFGR